MNYHTSISIKRLKQEKDKLGSYAKLARKYDVNVRYVWELLALGKIPTSKKIRNKLGIIPASLERTRARNHNLDEIARSWGYDGWSNYESEILKRQGDPALGKRGS